MATECPDCGSWFNGPKCACGYVPIPEFHGRARAAVPCRQCQSDSVTSDEHGPLCKSCFAAKPVKPHNPTDFSQHGRRAWAYKMIARHESAERIPASALAMAREVAAPMQESA